MVTARALFEFGSPRTPQRRPSVDPAPPTVRTAIVLPSGSRFSVARPNSMETVVRTLAAAGGQESLRIFCCEGGGDCGPFAVERLPAGARRRPALMRGLEAFRPDVVEHHQQVKQALAIALAFPDAAHLLYRHNALKPPRHALDAWRYNARYDRLDGFVFVSTAQRRLFTDAYPALAGRAHVVPNPIDAGPWLAAPTDREPLIAFAGRAMPEKGVDVVCAALPEVLHAHPDWRAVLLLNDWDEHGGWAQPHVAPLERFGHRVVVRRSAPLGEVQSWMKRAAIALTPSVWDEPFGLTAVEAHAAGAALISSGRGGLREASGPHALFIDEVTRDRLADAIDLLIMNPTARRALAEAAQTYVLVQHAPERRALELHRIRRQIAARRGARHGAAQGISG